MARENTGWGWDGIVGALSNLGHRLSDQTVGNILRRHGIAPAPKRSQTTSRKDFITAHMDVLAGADFCTVEGLSWRGLATYYVLFFLHLESRRVSAAGITRYPDQEWMEQIARSATHQAWGYLDGCRYVLSDRDTKFCPSFRSVLAAGGVKTMALPTRSPNLNVFAERWVDRQGGVSVEVDSVRRRPAVPDPGRVQHALSRRTQSSGQRQQAAFPGCLK